MHITNTSFSLESALGAMPVVRELIALHQEYPSFQGIAFVVPEPEWPRGMGVDQELLLIKLPDDLEPQLQALAEVRLIDYNRVSNDLLRFSTFIALQTEDAVVEFDVWETDFPRQARRFFIGLIAGNSFVLSCREFDEGEEEAFLGGLQGACIATGPNYRPHREWSEEDLRAAAEGRFVPDTWGDEVPRRRVECGTTHRVERQG